MKDHFLIQPGHFVSPHRDYGAFHGGIRCPDGFRYGSDTNPWWLTDAEIAQLVESIKVRSDANADRVPEDAE